MPEGMITAEKSTTLLLKDGRGELVGVVVQDRQCTFYSTSRMNLDAIEKMFKMQEIGKAP